MAVYHPYSIGICDGDMIWLYSDQRSQLSMCIIDSLKPPPAATLIQKAKVVNDAGRGVGIRLRVLLVQKYGSGDQYATLSVKNGHSDKI